MYAGKTFSFVAVVFFFLLQTCPSASAQPASPPSSQPSPKRQAPLAGGGLSTPPQRVKPLSPVEAQTKLLLQENLKLNPRTQKEMAFALPPKDCDRICLETIASVLYNSGMRFRKLRYTTMARYYMEYILLYYGSTRYARLAQLSLIRWHSEKKSRDRVRRGFPKRDDGIDRRGRIEFIISSSFFGVYFGSMMPFAFVSSSPGGAWIGISLITFTGAAIVSSILGTMNAEMTPGQASAATIGFSWGLLTGGLLSLGISTSIGSLSSSDLFKFLFVGPLLGYAAGVVVPRFARPTAGQIAFGASMGAWLGTYSALIWGMTMAAGSTSGRSPWELIVPVLLSAYGGLIGGAFLQQKLDWSRGRTMFINLGGFAGAVVGGGILAAASSANPSVLVILLTQLLTSLGGMVVAFFLTNKMKPESVEEGKRIASLGALMNFNQGEWVAGVPVPVVSMDPTAPGANRVEVHVPVLRGQW